MTAVGRVAGNGRPAADIRTPRRAIRRRRPLPSSRAVVGGFLVALTAVAVFAAYGRASSRPREQYVVAARAIAPGTRLTGADLRDASLDIPDAGVRAVLFSDPRALIGASVISPIAAGDLIEASAVVGRGGATGTREVSLQLDRSRAVAGTLKPGELVDVLGTFGSGAGAYTAVLVAHARIIAINNVAGSLGETSNQLVTFAVENEADAEAIADAGVAAQVTLIRSADGGDATPAGLSYRPPSTATGRTGG